MMIPMTMIPVTMTMPQRMRKHSVEKTRVSPKLVSVSPPPPPPPPAFRIISTRSANYRCSNISSPHKFSSSFKTSFQSSVDAMALELSGNFSKSLPKSDKIMFAHILCGDCSVYLANQCQCPFRRLVSRGGR